MTGAERSASSGYGYRSETARAGVVTLSEGFANLRTPGLHHAPSRRGTPCRAGRFAWLPGCCLVWVEESPAHIVPGPTPEIVLRLVATGAVAGGCSAGMFATEASST
jgi:hypothetical protein